MDVRLAIARLPVKLPRGEVDVFCLEHGISRASFYRIRAVALDGREIRVGSRRPRSNSRQGTPAKRLLTRRADPTGTIAVSNARYHLGVEHAAAQIHVALTTDTLEAFTAAGTHIRTYQRGKPGEYVRSHLPRTRRPSQPE